MSKLSPSAHTRTRARTHTHTHTLSLSILNLSPSSISLHHSVYPLTNPPQQLLVFGGLQNLRGTDSGEPEYPFCVFLTELCGESAAPSDLRVFILGLGYTAWNKSSAHWFKK